MTENEVKSEKGSRPQYKGDGVAVWENHDKNGYKYLSIQLLGSLRVKAFVYPYPKQQLKLADDIGEQELIK